ncbi:MAG: hypothetical protein L3J82_04950 [Planctomycetes bacterium]|nr:hypothetical protein [Planctomycetota bacterium]
MKLLLLSLAVLLSCALSGQPPVPPANGNGEPKPVETKPETASDTSDFVTREELQEILDSQAAELEAAAKEQVDSEVRRQFEHFQPIRSRRELFVELAGGINIKYRQAEHEPRGDQASDGHRPPNGINLTDAWLTVFAGYSDVVSSELTIRYNGDYRLRDEEIIEIPRAMIVYNRPLSQFAPPGWASDSLLIGVDSPFWQQATVGETMALGQRAFHEDPRAQIRYTLRILNYAYLITAISDGTLLAGTGVDDSQNYPILQDDSTRYTRGLGDDDEISRFLEFQGGLGFIYDFNSTSFLKRTTHFSPADVTANNTNFINALAWFSVDRLSENELKLIEGLMRFPFKGGTASDPGGEIRRSKWRAGVNVDFGMRVAGGDLFLRTHYIHAEVGRFVRNAFGIEASYTIELPRIPFFMRVTPIFRFSQLNTNNDENPLDVTDPLANPLRVSSGGVSGFTLSDASGFAANRSEIMIGLNLTMARNVIVGFEIVFNSEDFKPTRSVPRDTANSFYLLRITAKF